MRFDDISEMQTVRDLLRYVWSAFNREDLFYGHGTDNPWDEACHLVLGTLKLPWDVDRSLVLDARVTESEKAEVGRALRQRIVQRMPLPYILGEAWFMGMPFEVNPRVLIPRSPIAELLNNRFEPWIPEGEPLRILDLCCGSGCIGIAAAMVYEDAEVVLSDISEEALAVAARNIERYGLDDRVSVCRSDLFEALQGPFDLILTNPPYVDELDMNSLPPEYRHEPRLALESGDDGLDCTRRILANARRYLTPDGWLVGEVGNSLEALMGSYPELPFILPEFEQGGHGVFVLAAADLPAHAGAESTGA